MTTTEPRRHPFPTEDLPPVRHQQIRNVLTGEIGHRSSWFQAASSAGSPARLRFVIPATALAVGAAVVGVGAVTGTLPDGLTSADHTAAPAASAPAPLPSSLPASPPVKAAPSPSSSPTPSSAGKRDPSKVAYPIPKAVAFTKAQLPPGQRHLDDQGNYAATVTVAGQSCQDSPDLSADQVAGRWWAWWASDSVSDETVDLVVTGWAKGTGPKNFQDLRTDTGVCRWMETQHVHAGTVKGADDTYESTATSNGLHYGRVAVRVGDLVAGVSVQSPKGTADALKTAQGLAAIAVKNLALVHIPAGS